ncbi:Aldehyde/histidinol dehydrogenase [Schizophyllum amplum]|uniref:Aldehyde dehydrogenase n=1 Tax=Schizophyllum amplum TaxID=97359 RepID=A0A550C2Q8_9AGAR|nr:Aldehyde/histidinol dehydrogenase [Auriculariopsis ampla]
MAATSLKYTDINEIPKAHSREAEGDIRCGQNSASIVQRHQLLQLARMIQENAEAMQDAIFRDYGKQKLEVVIGELSPAVSACINAANKLEEWAKPEKPVVEEWRSSWDTTIHKVPKGVAIIISPWNYPYIISLAPLVGAIAAGCPVLLKPSEHTANVSTLYAELFPKYLDTDSYAVANGAIAETTCLLDLKWGSTSVGRVVAAAAAKQLTPVTLELGSKSPVYVDAENTDIELAAKRLLWAARSTRLCVSPDYILVPREHQDAFVTAIQKAYAQFYPNGALDSTSTLTGGEVVAGGKEGAGKIEPTVVKNVSRDDPLLKGEIFGPIMPIVPVDGLEEAIKIIKSYGTPLVMHVFTESMETRDKFLYGTQSGTLVLNDRTDADRLDTVYEMPFGGQGESGYGSYLGKYSFDTFTHQKSYINVPLAAEPFLGYRYPPYTEEAYNFFAAGTFQKIPDN